MHPPTCLAIRVDPANPDHHLWRNHRTWWIHYFVHEGNRKRRVRRSLGTGDLAAARAARDALFAAMRANAEAGNPRAEAVA
ncbi:MAG: hypothetical protein FJ265_07630 [Planctomycetes bacterium]|nr:hypothetical protein [Planctomycetota bacterium]